MKVLLWRNLLLSWLLSRSVGHAFRAAAATSLSGSSRRTFLPAFSAPPLPPPPQPPSSRASAVMFSGDGEPQDDGDDATVGSARTIELLGDDDSHVHCFCGAVQLVVRGAPTMGRSLCHCSICRRLSGAPFSYNGLWSAECVEIVQGEESLQPLKTSRKVERVRCERCGGPVFAKLGGGKVIALPMPNFDQETLQRPDFRPQHHQYYADRVIDVPDDLPKYASSTKGDLWRP